MHQQPMRGAGFAEDPLEARPVVVVMKDRLPIVPPHDHVERVAGETRPELAQPLAEQMREAARWLWFELGIGAELAGAAALAAARRGPASTQRSKTTAST